MKDQKKFLWENKKGFTLAELLITLGVIAIITTIAIVTLNPSEMLKRSRDSRRIADLTNLALALHLAYDQNLDFGICDGTKIYASVPSDTPLSNDNLPSGVSWVQVPATNLRKTDGTGWLPVNFASLGLLATLPVDPRNSASDYLFYTYTCNSSKQFVLTAWFESKYYGPAGLDARSKTDGGPDPYLYEVGTNLFIHPLKPVGYWSFDEGSGTVAYDSSGNNNHGTLYNGPTWVDGKVGKALSFDGVDDYVAISNNIDYSSNAFTVIAWIKTNDISNCRHSIVSSKENAASGFVLAQPEGACNKIRIWANINGTWQSVTTLGTIQTGTLYHVAGTYNGNLLTVYLNGVPSSATYVGTLSNNSNPTTIGARNSNNTNYFNGLIDEVGIYNRALTEAEIRAIYNATK